MRPKAYQLKNNLVREGLKLEIPHMARYFGHALAHNHMR